MIAHLVLFKPRDTLPAERRRAILDAIVAVANACRAVRACRVGRRVRHGLPGYEAMMRTDYEYALLLEFDNVEGLREYLGHPEHARVGEFFTTAADAALAYDYELFDPEAAL